MFKQALVIALGCGWLLAAGAGDSRASDAAADKTFRAGAYAIDVTPQELPVIVNGGMSQRTSAVITDRLHARCLVLDDGQTRIAFAIVDSCVIPGSLMDAAKDIVHQRIGIPPHRILIAATHAHSTPSVLSVLGSGENADYGDYLRGQIAEGIVAANERLVPARIGWGVGRDPENVFCRRFVMKPGTAATNPFGGTTNDRAQMNPGYQNANAVRRTGPADPDVSVLSVQTRDGRPLALLANYSTHYAGAPGLSADYFGVFCRRIGELIDAPKREPAFVAMMTNGTSGDANCCDFVNPRRRFTYVSVGEDTARAAFAAYQQIEYVDWAPIAMAETVLELGVRKPSDEEVAKAEAFLAEMGDRLPRTVPEVYARETVLLADWPPTRPVKLQAIRIGSLGIAAMPCEVYGVTGLTIKKQSPLQPTFSIELANGYNGYLPSPDQFALGGYTTWRARSSYLEVDAEPTMRKAVLALLNQVAEPTVTKLNEVTRHDYPWGWIRWTLNAELDPQAEMTFGVVYIKPHQENALHSHPNCAEFLHVVEGSCQHLLGKKWVNLKAGDTIRIPRGIRHRARTGDEPCRAVIVYNTGRREMVVLPD